MESKRKPNESEAGIGEFVSQMTPEEKTLLIIRDALYDGRWEEMQTDLEQRLQGRPYVFKLASRIEDDIARIRRMRDVEERYSVNLKEYV